MNSYKFKEIENKINLKGRTAFIKDMLCLEFTNSGFEFNIDLKSEINITLNSTGEYSMVGVIIDGDAKNMIRQSISLGMQTISFLGNVFGKHTIRFVKLTEFARSQLELFSIDFDGDILEKPPVKELKFEFYGDSLTCGYGNMCSTRNTPVANGLVQDGFKTYCSLISQRLDAEFNIVASSGQGVLTSCDGDPEGTIFKYWNMAAPNHKIKWDFSKYIPDYVFINIGTNDITYTNYNNGPETNWVEYKSEIKRLIDGINNNYPNCKIIFVVCHDQTNPYFKSMVNVYEELKKEYDNYYLFADMHSNQLGGDWHPSIEDHKMLYNQLLKHMQETFDFE